MRMHSKTMSLLSIITILALVLAYAIFPGNQPSQTSETAAIAGLKPAAGNPPQPGVKTAAGIVAAKPAGVSNAATIATPQPGVSTAARITAPAANTTVVRTPSNALSTTAGR